MTTRTRLGALAGAKPIIQSCTEVIHVVDLDLGGAGLHGHVEGGGEMVTGRGSRRRHRLHQRDDLRGGLR